MAAAFLVMIPMIYLSGLIFPIENMPPVIQAITYAIPLRYYANVIRGIFLMRCRDRRPCGASASCWP